MTSRLEKISNIITVKSILLESLIDRLKKENLTQNELDLLQVIDTLKKQVSEEERV